LGIHYLTECVTFRTYDFFSSNLSGKQIAQDEQTFELIYAFLSDGENPSRFSG
jgi:hypothetical protein